MKFRVRDIQPVEAAAAAEIMRECLVDDRFVTEQLVKWCNDPIRPIFGAWAVDEMGEEGPLVGVSRTFFSPDAYQRSYDEEEAEQYDVFVEWPAPQGSLAGVSVTAAYMQQGAGKALMRRRLRWLRDHGCVWVITDSWLHGQINRMSWPMLENAGFVPISEIEGIFGSGHHEGHFHCPTCKTVNCVCTSRFYVTKLVAETNPEDTTGLVKVDEGLWTNPGAVFTELTIRFGPKARPLPPFNQRT